MSDTKEIVLKYLEQHRGTFSSGEEIASELSLSRNSIWKAIEGLRRDGFHIEAAPRRGYSLSGEADILTSTGIAAYLTSNISADRIKVYDSLESTNKSAKSEASLGAAHGTVIIAGTQTMGSGRKSRNFYSPEGGIYMSIILDPLKLPFSNTSLITAFTAVCICEALEKLALVNPKIKWINDIYLDSKKICGILTESGTDFETGDIQWIVVGIGLNFCVRESVFPSDIRRKAGSLFSSGEETVSRNHLIAEIINLLLDDKGSKKSPSIILTKYKDRMNMLGRDITVINRDSTTYPAKAVDIDENGKLIVELPDKTRKILSSEEISITLP